jgi:magnesium and cobalt exporter, CNNM family
MSLNLILLIVTMLLFSAFFSGIEIAYLSSNKLQIELQGKQGILSGRIFSFFIKNTSYFIGTTLIGNTISLVLYGIFMAQLIEPELRAHLPIALNNEASVLVIQTLTSTLLVLFTAEFLPKSFFLINPNFMLSALAVPFLIVYVLLFPLVFSIVKLSKVVITHVFGLEYSDEKPVFGLIDLNNFVKNMKRVRHENDDIELDTRIFHNALEFKTVLVRECMIPRTEIIAVESEEGLEPLREAFVESGHSKIIVYKETIDEVIGYCHSSALFRKPQTIKEILTPIIIVPETTLANELMIKFINERKSLAVVLDEFGGTSGIVSMEDVIEEIFGEIEDEHDEDNLIEQKIDEHTYLLSARLEIDYLNDNYNWKLPEGDYETLSGLILTHTEDIPEPGEKVEVPPYLFTIQSTLDNRIDVVKMIIEKPSD